MPIDIDIDIEALRQELYRAVDGVLMKYNTHNQSKDELTITPAETLQHPYTQKWSETEVYTFSKGRWYDVNGTGVPEEGLRVLVARNTVDRWGKLQRPGAMVFGKLRSQRENASLTPYVAFLEDDHGAYTAIIPNPANPRSDLKENELKTNDPLLAHFDSAIIKRIDECFDSVKKGSTLRLVVQPDDEIAMIKHGLWVLNVRKRFKSQS
jgi:hypothetical protein